MDGEMGDGIWLAERDLGEHSSSLVLRGNSPHEGRASRWLLKHCRHGGSWGSMSSSAAPGQLDGCPRRDDGSLMAFCSEMVMSSGAASSPV